MLYWWPVWYVTNVLVACLVLANVLVDCVVLASVLVDCLVLASVLVDCLVLANDIATVVLEDLFDHCFPVKCICNIFELVFTLCHKLKNAKSRWKQLYHPPKKLCHPADTVMSHRIQLYHPLVYFFCILITSGWISNVTVAKQSKQRSGIIKRNKESKSSVFHFI